MLSDPASDAAFDRLVAGEPPPEPSGPPEDDEYVADWDGADLDVSTMVDTGVSPTGDTGPSTSVDRSTRGPVRRTSWTADELMAEEFPEQRMAVDGVIAEGVNLLVGPPKTGKSYLCGNIAVSVASGGKALGSIDVTAGDVLYLALEDTPRRLQKRLGALLAGSPAPPRLTFAVECAPFPDGASRVGLWLTDHPDARLVIVDVFTKVRPRPEGNLSRYDADYAAMTAFKSLADRYGVAFLVVHHTRKAESDDFLDAVSGTQGLAGAADAVLVLTRSRGAAQAVLKVTGRDIEETERALDFDPSTGTWRLLDGPASDWALQDTRRRILHLLRDDEPRTPKAIASALGLKHDTIKQSVRRMVTDGQLDTDGAGSYFPPLSPVTPVTPSPTPGDTVTGVTPDTGSPDLFGGDR